VPSAPGPDFSPFRRPGRARIDGLAFDSHSVVDAFLPVEGNQIAEQSNAVL